MLKHIVKKKNLILIFSVDNQTLSIYNFSCVEKTLYADLAQLVEQLICNQQVASSSLAIGSKQKTLEAALL